MGTEMGNSIAVRMMAIPMMLVRQVMFRPRMSRASPTAPITSTHAMTKREKRAYTRRNGRKSNMKDDAMGILCPKIEYGLARLKMAIAMAMGMVRNRAPRRRSPMLPR